MEETGIELQQLLDEVSTFMTELHVDDDDDDEDDVSVRVSLVSDHTHFSHMSHLPSLHLLFRKNYLACLYWFLPTNKIY